MKKFLFLILIGSFLFAASNTNNNINEKLNLILNKLNTLEQQIDQKNQEIEMLKKQLQKQQMEIKKESVNTKKELAVRSCNNLKVVKYNYKYHWGVLPYYTITVTLKNNYPYTITYINGNIYFDDKDGTTLLKQFVKQQITLKPGQSVTLHFERIIIAQIEKELRTEKRSRLHVYFSPTLLKFKNAKQLECF